MRPILSSFDYFIFDVDRTIASNDKVIEPAIIEKLRVLIKHANIVIVTSRSIHEGLEILAQSFFQSRSGHQLYFFPVSGGQAYSYDFMTGGLLKRYDKAKGDPHFQQFYQNFYKSLATHNIEVVTDLPDHERERKVRVHDRGAQVTLFFSNRMLRMEYECVLRDLSVSFVRHGMNTLHVVPVGVDKRLAIDYLLADANRFLVFADAFYDFPDTGRQGNDLSFAEFPPEKVTCINVGSDLPKKSSGVFYMPSSDLTEWKLTDYFLDKILKNASFEELGLIRA